MKNFPETKPGFVWIRKENGVVVDICDHYPLHPEAIQVPRDHPEVVSTLAQHAADREEIIRKQDNLRRALAKLAES